MSLLIKNVRVLGGVREFKENSDVFIVHDKIAAIGNFPDKKADEILDGQGAYLSPGFIDVNTDLVPLSDIIRASGAGRFPAAGGHDHLRRHVRLIARPVALWHARISAKVGRFRRQDQRQLAHRRRIFSDARSSGRSLSTSARSPAMARSVGR